MNPKPPGCSGCPAEHFGLGFVPPTGPETASWVVIGQGPGQQEAIFGQPFWPNAPAGRMLRGWLHEAGIDARSVAFGNIVCCWLPSQRLGGELGKGSRIPTRGEVAHCWREHVGPWLHRISAEAHLLAVGAPATRFLLGLSEDEPAERLAGVTHRVELPPLEPPLETPP